MEIPEEEIVALLEYVESDLELGIQINTEELERTTKNVREWLSGLTKRAPDTATLFGMRVEIANWLKPGQWFIRPSRRG